MESKKRRKISKYNLSPAMELILQEQIQQLRERMIDLKKGCQDRKISETPEMASNLVKEEIANVTSETSSSDFYYALPEESSPLQPSSKVSSPDRSDENLQLHSDLEDSRVNEVDKAPEDKPETEEVGKFRAEEEKPEVKKPNSEDELHCKKCAKVFNTDWELVIHYEAHHLQNNYKCDVCGVAVFKYAAALRAHQRECRRKFDDFKRKEVSEEKVPSLQSQLYQIAPAAWIKFPCDTCPKIFSHVYTLREHKQVVHFGKRYSCRVCKKQFSNRSYFRQHEKACEQNQLGY